MSRSCEVTGWKAVPQQAAGYSAYSDLEEGSPFSFAARSKLETRILRSQQKRCAAYVLVRCIRGLVTKEARCSHGAEYRLYTSK